MAIIKILAPLSSTPNALVNENGNNWTPIVYHATLCHYTEIVKFLCSLTKNPNAADMNRWTPLHAASAFGFSDIVNFLVPLIENPNSCNGGIPAPIETARNFGHMEVVRILQAYDFA